MRELISSQAEDYLKALHDLGGKHVSTQSMADQLKVAPASVTGMLKRLSELKLVSHAPYQGATLTRNGERIALELIRHHRLLELYLHRALGYALEDVHDEAERLEHVISEEFESRIANFLGEPTHDPHGDPIPSANGVVPRFATRSLSSCNAGEAPTIGRVAQNNRELLRHLVKLGLTPGTKVRIAEINRHAGTITVNLRRERHTLSLAAAEKVWVNP